AGDDVQDRARAFLSEACGSEVRMQRGQVVCAYPAQHQVLLHRAAHRAPRVAPRDVRQLPQLGGRDVSEGQCDGGNRVARLRLWPRVALAPAQELCTTL